MDVRSTDIIKFGTPYHRGAGSDVYLYPTYVIKRIYNDAGAIAWLNWCIANSDNPYVPTVHRLEQQGTVTIAELERLSEIPAEFVLDKSHVPMLTAMHDVGVTMCADITAIVSQYTTDITDPGALAIKTAAHIVKDNVQLGLDLCLKYPGYWHNLMLRGSQLVILDPISQLAGDRFFLETSD